MSSFVATCLDMSRMGWAEVRLGLLYLWSILLLGHSGVSVYECCTDHLDECFG